MMTNHIIAIVLNLLVLGFLTAFTFVLSRAFKSVITKFDMLNDYLRTIITKYSEEVTYSQAVILLSIFAKASKYKIYTFILDKLADADSRVMKSAETLTEIIIFIETTIRDSRNNLGAFKYNHKHLSECFYKNDGIGELEKKIESIIRKKQSGTLVLHKAQKLEIKEILSNFFDSIIVDG